MTKKVKEKSTQSTNIDLDNEIIIGIKTLPEIEPKKKNKKKTTTKKSKNVKKAKATTKSKKGEFEFKFEEDRYWGSYDFINLDVTVNFEKKKGLKFLDDIYVSLPYEDNPTVLTLEEILYME